MDNNVEILTNLKIIGITDSSVTAVDRDQGVVNIESDKVVLAMGLISQAGLYEEVKDKVREVYLIGDCVEPRRVGEATRDGYRIGSIL